MFQKWTLPVVEIRFRPPLTMSQLFDSTGYLNFKLFSAMMPTLLAFPLDIGLMIREHRNRWYSIGAYFLAKTFADLPFQVFFDLLFNTIGYFLSGQIPDPKRFFLFNTIVTVNSMVIQSMGLLVGAAAPRQS